MAQKPVLRGEVGCACAAREVSVERGGMGERGILLYTPYNVWRVTDDSRGALTRFFGGFLQARRNLAQSTRLVEKSESQASISKTNLRPHDSLD